MRKRTALLLSAALCAGLLAGCGNPGATTAAPSGTSSSGQEKLSGVVNTDGSTSMEQVVKALGEKFMEEYSGVTINYTGSGSGSGVENAITGAADIGLASRALTEEEEANGAVAHVVALDGLAIVVHPDCPVDGLTVEQITGIFTGEISNWSELGGGGAPIAVYGREGGSGTRTAFEEILGVEDQCVYRNEYSATGDMIGSIAGNPNAIGCVSLSAVNDTVKAVSVNGVACTEDAVKDGSYAIQRPLIMITREGAGLSAAAQAFLEYALSADAAGVISVAGAVPPR